MANGGIGFSKISGFYKKEVEAPGVNIVVMAVTSGVAGGAILGLINTAAEASSDKEIHAKLFIMFVLALFLYIYTKRFALDTATKGVEIALNKLRVRITDKLRRADLHFIETTADTEIYTKLSQETAILSQAAFMIVEASQSAIVLLACFVYIFIISKVAFLLTVTAIAIGMSLYFVNSHEIMKDLQKSAQKEEEFFGLLSHLLRGFKEVKMSYRRNEEVYADISAISNDAKRLKVKTNAKVVVDFMFAQVFFYSLIGMNIFILPSMVDIDAKDLVKLAASLLFIIGPLTTFVSSIHIFAKTALSIDTLYALEDMLDKAISDSTYMEPPATPAPFNEISVENISFSYVDHAGTNVFQVGPLDFRIKKGETVFIVGGNGSGKSTLLKLLTGLYAPRSGKIKIDGKTVEPDRLQEYRELFSAIFGDFHLFPRLYGVDNPPDEKVDNLLRLMELQKKTEYKHGGFTNLDLSTGQRKRLALIVSFLEDKPVYIFDEWAADQDPEFRSYFYDVILSDLKKAGKTVIAVSHDDRYFSYADRTLKLDYGQIASEITNR